MVYSLFYTGIYGDDPRNAVIIGENSMPVFIRLETVEEEGVAMRSKTIVRLVFQEF
jgi:hypothetical protein